MTNWDVLMRIVNSPASLGGFIIFCICLICLGGYLFQSAKIIARDPVSKEEFLDHKKTVSEKLSKLVTEDYLTSALSRFMDKLRSEFVHVDTCKFVHSQNVIPVNEHEELKATQKLVVETLIPSVVNRMDRIELKINGKKKEE